MVMASGSVYWNHSTGGVFTVNSAYDMQQHTVGQQSSLNPVWQLIWKRSGPERIKAFLWETARDRLMINEIGNAGS
jgi:hypothetical protein